MPRKRPERDKEAPGFIRGETHFAADFEEPGTKKVMGRTFQPSNGALNFDHIKKCLAFLAMHPRTINHICRKLAGHFVKDNPPIELVASMRDEWSRTNGNLLSVYRVMVMHPSSRLNKKFKVKRPIDYIISGVRAIGATPEMIHAMKPDEFNWKVMGGMAAMGQDLFYVGGPNGWPETAASWITPGTYAPRINWAFNTPSILMGSDLLTPDVSVSHILAGYGTPELSLAVSRAPSLKDSMTILLASNEFNRR